MNKLTLLILLLAISSSLFAQIPPPIEKPIVWKRGKDAKAQHIQNKKKPDNNYDINKLSTQLDYIIHLKNDTVIKANSDIVLDTENGKYYLYIVIGDNTQKIYPEDTKFITHSNPYDSDTNIMGFPKNGRWLFTLNTGKIKTYAYSSKTNQFDFYSIDNGELKLFDDMDEMINLLKDNITAYQLLRKKEFYKAIKSYNKSVR